MANPTLFLNKNTYFCILENFFVFLDLDADRYISVQPAYTDSLCRQLGLKLPGNSGLAINAVDQQSLHDEFNKTKTDMVNSQLVTEDCREGKLAVPMEHTAVSQDANGYDIDRKVKLRFSHFFKLTKSVLKIVFRLKFRSIITIVKNHRTLKARSHIDVKKAANRLNQSQIKEIVEVFKLLRPIYYTALDHCLADSLILADFLSSYGLVTEVVVAVHGRPFRAHCWVQRGGTVLNDNREHVAQYTPILVF